MKRQEPKFNKLSGGLPLWLAAGIVLVSSCSKVPSHVIQPEEMANLLADVHISESVIEMNRANYRTDSSKQALRTAVYERHGVTQAQVDTSFEWYGRNISYYMDVYNRTIEILDHRLIETGNRIAAENAISIAGDSVDIWPNPRFIALNDRLPSREIMFSFQRDHNWEKGDSYTWRAKFFHNSGEGRWGLAVEYANGTVEFINNTFSGDGWKEISLFCDSTQIPVKIYGYLDAMNSDRSATWIDSIAMVRNRLHPDSYSRRFRQKTVPKFREPVEVKEDSITATAEE